MLDLVGRTLLAYLLGNVMGGRVVGWLRGGVDLRRQGSGNIGATNALRTQGVGFALGVLAIDVLKGVVAVLVVPALPAFAGSGLDAQAQAYVCGVAVTLGHCYPALSGFRGGKGVATLAGVFGALLTPALPWMLGVFALVVVGSGYVSLATIAAALTALAYVALGAGAVPGAGAVWFTVAMAVLVLWTHRENVRRLLSGTENRFDKAMIWRRWLKS